MSQAVVDRLEVVQVEHQHRIAPAAALQSLVSVLESIAEQRSIRQPRQGIMKCLMLELTLKPHTISHIVRTNDHRGLAVEDRLASVHFDIEHLADFGAVPDTFEVCASADQRMQVAEHLAAIFRRTDLAEVESQEL